MNPDQIRSVFSVGELQSLSYAARFIQSRWLVKFLIGFFPVFLGSGLLLGMIYVLVMRAIRVDRANVEAWFDAQRHRLQLGPITNYRKSPASHDGSAVCNLWTYSFAKIWDLICSWSVIHFNNLRPSLFAIQKRFSDSARNQNAIGTRR